MKAWQEDQIGQLFFLRLGESRWTESLGRALRHSAPGGVLLSEPLPRSPQSICELLVRIFHHLPHPPFLAVRQEGGANDLLSGILPPLPSPRAAAAKGLSAVTRLGELSGEALRLLGFNTNFAPRLDLSTSFAEKSWGAQTFASDPNRAAECGRAFVRGLERRHILACGKHFPGWGSVSALLRDGLATSAKPMADLWREDLVPFRELLPRLPMALISSAAYKAYDFDHPRPASLSTAVVTGLLRQKLGYHGLALAYELESAAGMPDVGQAAVQSLNAGCDLLVVDEGEPLEIARQEVKAALVTGKLSAERIEQSLERIRAAKRRLALPSGKLAPSTWKQLEERTGEFSREFLPEVSRDA